MNGKNGNQLVKSVVSVSLWYAALIGVMLFENDYLLPIPQYREFGYFSGIFMGICILLIMVADLHTIYNVIKKVNQIK